MNSYYVGLISSNFINIHKHIIIEMIVVMTVVPSFINFLFIHPRAKTNLK